jgi:hypothetical protein
VSVTTLQSERKRISGAADLGKTYYLQINTSSRFKLIKNLTVYASECFDYLLKAVFRACCILVVLRPWLSSVLYLIVPRPTDTILRRPLIGNQDSAWQTVGSTSRCDIRISSVKNKGVCAVAEYSFIPLGVSPSLHLSDPVVVHRSVSNDSEDRSGICNIVGVDRVHESLEISWGHALLGRPQRP